MSIFDESTPRFRGCAVCGERNAIAVLVRAQELDQTGSKKAGLRSTAKMLSFCQEHGQDAFIRVRDELLRAAPAARRGGHPS